MPKNLSYSLHFPGHLRRCDEEICTWQTNRRFPYDNFTNDNNPPSYYAEGFLTIQNAIAMAYINSHNRSLTYKNLPEILVKPLPYPSRYQFTRVSLIFIPLFFLMSFTYAFANSVRYITNEKEKQLKETMKIMGLTNWMHHLGWFIRTVIMLLIPIVIVTVLFTVNQ